MALASGTSHEWLALSMNYFHNLTAVSGILKKKKYLDLSLFLSSYAFFYGLNIILYSTYIWMFRL
jgi:hypothetical protein